MNPYPNRLPIVCGHRGMYPDQKVWPFGESIPAADGRSEVLTVWSRSGERRFPGRRRDRFRCPICGHNPRPSEKDWHEICDRVRRAGLDTLDISLIR